MHIEKPKVTILRHTADPEQVVAAAARLCYSDSGIEALLDTITPKKMSHLIGMCLSQGHHSVFEHASFTFGIEGVSRAMTHQLVRHRIASYSQQSQRYVKFEDAGFVLPPEIDEDEYKKELFLKALQSAENSYAELLASGVKAEDARYVLPNAAASKIIVTMNARELRHFFRLRCCNRAQWEIRSVAIEMLRQSRAIAPLLFDGCGPVCLSAPCPEGKMTCGKVVEVRAYFAALSEGTTT